MRQINRNAESLPYIRGMVAYIGFASTKIFYHRDARYAGKTKYPFKKMLNFAGNAICAFSNKPLKLAYILSLTIAAPFFFYLLFTYIKHMFFDLKLVPGWLSLMMSIMLFGGANLFMLGIIGEYLGRIYMQTTNRPLFIVMEDTDDV